MEPPITDSEIWTAPTLNWFCHRKWIHFQHPRDGKPPSISVKQTEHVPTNKIASKSGQRSKSGMKLLLKALCHAIRADCLLMNPHAAKQNWAWWTADKFVSNIQVCQLRLSLQRIRCIKHRMCSSYSPYLSVFLPLAAHNHKWYSPYYITFATTEDRELVNTIIIKRCTHSISAYSRTLYCDTGRAHTSCTHFNWLFELMS